MCGRCGLSVRRKEGFAHRKRTIEAVGDQSAAHGFVRIEAVSPKRERPPGIEQPLRDECAVEAPNLDNVATKALTPQQEERARQLIARWRPYSADAVKLLFYQLDDARALGEDA